MHRYLLIILTLACGWDVASSQTPGVIRHFTRLSINGAVLDGANRLTVRWYDAPVGGTSVLTEDLDVTSFVGLTELRLGSVAGLPDTLLRRGSAWLAYAVNGGPEDPIRERILSMPYSRVAERAIVAERLAPEVTGVVTSVNEIAGAVRIEADSGMSIRRIGSVLRLTGQAYSAGVEHGEVSGNGTSWRFRIPVRMPLTSVADVTLRVSSSTGIVIGASVESYDAVANEILVVTSAVLSANEVLHWTYYSR